MYMCSLICVRMEISEVLVVLNLSDQSLQKISFDDDRVEGKFKNVFSGDVTNFSSNKELAMQPWEYLVFEK